MLDYYLPPLPKPILALPSHNSHYHPHPTSMYLIYFIYHIYTIVIPIYLSLILFNKLEYTCVCPIHAFLFFFFFSYLPSALQFSPRNEKFDGFVSTPPPKKYLLMANVSPQHEPFFYPSPNCKNYTVRITKKPHELSSCRTHIQFCPKISCHSQNKSR